MNNKLKTESKIGRMEFRIEPSLKQRFSEALSANGETATEILTRFIERYIENPEDKGGFNAKNEGVNDELDIFPDEKITDSKKSDIDDMQRVLLEIESLKLRVKLLELDK